MACVVFMKPIGYHRAHDPGAASGTVLESPSGGRRVVRQYAGGVSAGLTQISIVYCSRGRPALAVTSVYIDGVSSFVERGAAVPCVFGPLPLGGARVAAIFFDRNALSKGIRASGWFRFGAVCGCQKPCLQAEVTALLDLPILPTGEDLGIARWWSCSMRRGCAFRN